MNGIDGFKKLRKLNRIMYRIEGLNLFQLLWRAVSGICPEIANFKRKLRQYFLKYRSYPMSIICLNCGHENQHDALYCDECGEELTTNLSPVEEDTTPSEEPYAEVSSNDVTADKEPYAEVSSDDITSDKVEVDTELQSEAESASVETEESEQSPSSLPIGAATRLEIDEPPIQNIVSPPTTLELELPELPKALLINQETGEKFILPTGEKNVYIGRLNEEFPVQVDLSAIPNADLISRVQAAIHLENEVYYLEDAGSSNGTWLNENQIQSGTRFRQQLNSGDTIAFGRNKTVKFTFDLEDS